MSYILKQSAFIESLNATCSIHEHRATGCQIVHINNSDPENLFAYMFRTPPHDSTGLPHILEHTVLCGSQRFPLKDPFAYLAKTSLNTFLNAMTFPDRTVYPASSAVEKDLFNIMKVYGDAVFFPLLRREMFRQEGARIQFDEDGNPRLQGVVYNEMKGVYSNKEAIANRACMRSLFETGPYSYDSGGDPREIPFIGYDHFVDFHRRYYHPSNACIFLYGNIDTERYLDFFERNILSSFLRGQATKLSYATPRRETPTIYEVGYPAQSKEQQHSIIKNWLLPTEDDVVNLDTAHLVSELLVGNTTSPLYRALLESGLGKAVSSATGLSADQYESMFAAGLDEVSADNFDAVLDCIDTTLQSIREKGFDVKHVESLIAHTELQNREVRGGSAQGLHLMQKVAYAWTYNRDVVSMLETNKRIADLRAQTVSSPQRLQDWITEQLIENLHTGIVYCKADTQKIQKDEADEQARLEKLLEQRSKEFQEDEYALLAVQNASENKRSLQKMPTLHRSDVPKDIRRYDAVVHEDPCWQLEQQLFTNGVQYVHIGFDAADIPIHLLHYLPLLSAIFTECGTKLYSPETLNRLMDQYSTGIYTSISCDMHAITHQICPYFFVKTGFLVEHTASMNTLIQELLLHVDFQQHDRIRETMQEMITGFTSSLIQRGHLHALYRANRFLSPVADLEEQWHSVTQLQHLQDAYADMESTESSLRELYQVLFTRSRMKISLGHEETNKENAQLFVKEISESLPSSIPVPKGTKITHKVQYGHLEAIETPSQVSFNALTMRGIEHTSPLYAASLVLSQLLTTDYLWEQIRMRNGAYGAFAIPKGIENTFSFASYRDPHLDATFAAFTEALVQYSRTPLSAKEIDQALFGLLGSELRTIAPNRAVGIAFHYALHGISDDFRQHVRESVLEVKPEDVQQVAEQLKKEAQQTANRATVSGPGQLDASALQNIVRIPVPV